MSTATDTPATSLGLTPLPPASGRAGFGGALRSEWTKIRSVKSTIWTLGAVIVVSVGLSALGNWLRSSHTDDTAAQLAHEDLVRLTMLGIFFGALVMVVFGALSVTSEYSTGMIRTSLTAQPRRLTVFFAKLVVVTLVALVVGEIISFASFFVSSQFWVSAKGVSLSLSTPGALQAVIGGGLYLAVTAILTFGIGAALRHTAGAIVIGVALMFVVDIIVGFLPDSMKENVEKWLPADAGGQVWATQHDPGSLGAWSGFGVFLGYAVIALLLGLWVFKRRDA